MRGHMNIKGIVGSLMQREQQFLHTVQAAVLPYVLVTVLQVTATSVMAKLFSLSPPPVGQYRSNNAPCSFINLPLALDSRSS
jgi:hypothetical protein